MNTIKMRGIRREKSVVVSMPLGTASGRERLTGVFKYLGEGRSWNVNLVQDSSLLTPEAIRQAQGDGVDGFIIGFVVDSATRGALAESGIPTVFTLTDDGDPPFPPQFGFVQVDNVRIGEEAARHLKNVGVFRSFGYFSGYHRHYGWTRQREKGFYDELGKGGFVPSVLREENESLDVRRVAQWLVGLEKPAAILAACDIDGQVLLEVCRSMRVAVPEQVVVMGVENDEFVCNCSRPPLSSIHPANLEVGYRAAQELDRLMGGGEGGRRIVIPNPVVKIVTRESSRTLPPAGHLIRDALAYIRENACTGLRVDDVARHLHVSRRLLDLRFRQIRKTTVLDAISDVRMGEAKRRLEKTGDSVAAIAAACGYRSASRLCKVFRARVGVSPTAWRTSHGWRRK